MLVLLDRDGVLNEDLPHNGVTSLAQFRMMDGSAQAVAQLSQAGYQVAVVTNQSAVGKGLLSVEELAKIHAHLQQQVAAHGGMIARFYACHDHPDHPTHRRKPAPGMLLEALADFGALASHTPFIGDALTDMQAAQAAGCRPVLVRTGKGHQSERQLTQAGLYDVDVYDTLHKAVQSLLRESM